MQNDLVMDQNAKSCCFWYDPNNVEWSKMIWMVVNQLFGLWTIRITRPYLVWESLELKKNLSVSEEKSHKRKDWMVSIAWAICPLLGENKTEKMQLFYNID